MQPAFSIHYRHSAGNLHIRLEGRFDGMCAWQLIKTICRQNVRQGRVFVGTNGLSALLPEGIALFKTHMTSRIMPLCNLYLKGERGFHMAPDGVRVLITGQATAKPDRTLRLFPGGNGRPPCVAARKTAEASPESG